MPGVITAEEVNFLIYRYLQESGFVHSAFTFAHESLVGRGRLAPGIDVPPGALISFLHKGLQFVEVESHLEKDGRERPCTAPFGLLTPHVCSVPEEDPKTGSAAAAAEAASMDTSAAAGAGAAATPSTTVSPSEVTMLTGHKKEVLTCAFNPHNDTFASGSGDSTARIWTVGDGTDGTSSSASSIKLDHTPAAAGGSKEGGDVTILDWNPPGTMLATGTKDGKIRTWDQGGNLQHLLEHHTGPVMSLKWNESGEMLLSGSLDSSAAVWDVASGSIHRAFNFHTGAILDVDWQSPTQFASCAMDRRILVCSIEESSPIATFAGHNDEVNVIRWDPSRTLLASASDDTTAMIWNLKAGRLHTLGDHSKEVNTLEWCPTQPLILATASSDSTVKMWSAHSGECLHTLRGHTAQVYSCAFSPDGNFLASGSYDQHVKIWSTKDAKLVKSYKAAGTIFEVCWNSAGNKVAACYADKSVAVIDFRH